MNIVSIPVNFCTIGDILAEDVKSDDGNILVAKHTVINDNTKNELVQMRIPNIWLIQTSELIQENEKEYSKGFYNNYENDIQKTKHLINELATVGRLKINDINELSESIHGYVDNSSEIIKNLVKLKNYDEYTYTHCINVAFYAALIAKILSMPHLQDIIIAGLLHDIGKAKIPLEVLNKRGKLSYEEFEIIKTHTVTGFEMIKNNSELTDDIKAAVLQHHERMDGSGYPNCLTDKEIDLYAKIVAIADVFDAMTQNRVYKGRATPFEAFEMFLTSGNKFDLHIMEKFLKFMSMSYVGSMVLLNNGEIGEIVYLSPKSIIYPIVKVESAYMDLSAEKTIKIEMII